MGRERLPHKTDRIKKERRNRVKMGNEIGRSTIGRIRHDLHLEVE